MEEIFDVIVIGGTECLSLWILSETSKTEIYYTG